MTKQDEEFVSWYKQYFWHEKDLPCLKCSNKKIAECSNHETQTGCVNFVRYLEKTRWGR
jgi:hypothetical protein